MPTSQGIWTVCDVCGKRIPTREATYVRDKYSLQNGLVVCRKDLDPTQTLLMPVKSRERPPQELTKLRRQPTDSNYVDDSPSDRVPSAPQRGLAFPSTFANSITLRWEGPLDTGSDRITGYQITRAYPQASYQFVIAANTGVGETYYEDTVSDPSEESEYTIAAISAAGVGAVLTMVYYPTNRVPDDISSGATAYLLASDTNFTITTGDGDFIVVNNT